MKKRKKVIHSVLALTLSSTLAAMPVNAQNKGTENGKWKAGEYHFHTVMSPDANIDDNPSVINVENIFDKGFNEYALDYLFSAEHLRYLNGDAEGNKLNPTVIYSKEIPSQINKLESMYQNGKITADKTTFTGFEWDARGFDHVAVGIMDDDDALLLDAVEEFEYLFNHNIKDADVLNEYGADKIAKWGDVRYTDGIKVNGYKGIKWLKDNYPNSSYALWNHPSRKNGASSEVKVEDIRTINDIAPDIVFGFEGVLGNQMSPIRGELGEEDPNCLALGGCDPWLATVGGIWDALLGEGRDFWVFANSDFHFKTNTDGRYSSGYYPGEYSKNYTYIDGEEVSDVISGLRSGKSFAVMGDLINELDFNASTQKGSVEESAEMGEHLSVRKDEKVEITIRFKSPETNNYEPYKNKSLLDGTVTNKVEVNHVDLISGKVTGKIDPNSWRYSQGTNNSTEVVKRFTKDDWVVDDEGYNVITYTTTADTDRYYRLRGTNMGMDAKVDVAYGGETYTLAETIDGEPQSNPFITGNANEAAKSPSILLTDNDTRIGTINDRNYSDMWFYSNPIFVDIVDADVIGLYAEMLKDNIVLAEKALTRANVLQYTNDDIEAFKTVIENAKASYNEFLIISSSTDLVKLKETLVSAKESLIEAADIFKKAANPVTNITLSKTSATLLTKNKNTVTLKATAEPVTANHKNINWKSSNNKVATVDNNGKVTAVNKGTATITATAADGSGAKATAKITVKQAVDSIKISGKSNKVVIGKSLKLKSTVSPATANTKTVTWKSSNAKIATVDKKGKVIGKKAGTVKITATAKDGSKTKKTYTIKVKKGITKLNINKKKATLTKGQTIDLEITKVTPENAANKIVTWKSSNSKVAKVNKSGKVNALKKGNATITATAKDGSDTKVKCKITVK